MLREEMGAGATEYDVGAALSDRLRAALVSVSPLRPDVCRARGVARTDLELL